VEKYWKSFAWQITDNKYGSYVLELNGFQLDGIDFKPHIAVIANISQII
jgi:UDP-N-acetylmuramoylalanine-D-glutamate ligase